MTNNIMVLMVDDDKMLLDMYKERLELTGFKVETSSNGEECLAKIHQVKPDIVLLDIMMPKINGYDTLASIKSDPQTKDTPVIILSALVRDINKSKAIEAGADDYIIKSEVMPADVIKKIEAVLTKYHKDTPSSPENSPPPPAGSPSASSEPPSAPPPPTPSPPPLKAAPPPLKPEAKNPPPTREIQFEPQKAVPAANEKKVTWRTSPIVLFFLSLTVLLIIASDIFFYLRFLKAL